MYVYICGGRGGEEPYLFRSDFTHSLHHFIHGLIYTILVKLLQHQTLLCPLSLAHCSRKLVFGLRELRSAVLLAVQDYYNLFLPLLTLSISLSKFITQKSEQVIITTQSKKESDVKMIHILSAENCQRKKTVAVSVSFDINMEKEKHPHHHHRLTATLKM